MIESGRLYKLITEQWPKIVLAILAVIGVLEIVAGAADSRLQGYLFMWGVVASSVWFIFEKAEDALSDELRSRVAGQLGSTNGLNDVLRSLPNQMGLAFDRVFGEKHLSWKCYGSSTAISLILLVAYYTVLVSWERVVQGPSSNPWGAYAPMYVVMLLFGATYNAAWDYLSLLETRFVLSWASRGQRSPRALLGISVLDLIATTMISAVAAGVLVAAFVQFVDLPLDASTDFKFVYDGVAFAGVGGFFTSFFTSAWFWLYTASTVVAAGLVKMNHGLGFLLKATDVEKQPFRSMGFVSVIIVNLVFALGLPFVLLWAPATP